MELSEKVSQLTNQWSKLQTQAIDVMAEIDEIVDEVNARVSRWSDEELRATVEDPRQLELLDRFMHYFEHQAYREKQKYGIYAERDTTFKAVVGFSAGEERTPSWAGPDHVDSPQETPTNTMTEANASLSQLTIPEDNISFETLKAFMDAVSNFEFSIVWLGEEISHWDNRGSERLKRSRDQVFDAINALPADDEDAR